MLKRHLKYLVLVPLFLCTSCFEILEELSLNKDGTGHFNLTINLSQSKTKLNSILLLDSINGYKIPTKKKVTAQIYQLVNTLKKVDGVADIKNEIDFDDYIFNIEFDFKNIKTLNNVISLFSPKSNEKNTTKQFVFDQKENIFKRTHQYDLKKQFEKVKLKDRGVFKNASFVTIYKFQHEIKSSKNQNVRISKNKKAILLKVNIEDIIHNQKSIKNQIILH